MTFHPLSDRDLPAFSSRRYPGEIRLLIALSIAASIGLGVSLSDLWLLSVFCWTIALILTSLLYKRRPMLFAVSPAPYVMATMGLYGIVVPAYLYSIDNTSLAGVDYRPLMGGAIALTAVAAICTALGMLSCRVGPTGDLRTGKGGLRGAREVILCSSLLLIVALGNGAVKLGSFVAFRTVTVTESSGYLFYAPHLLATSLLYYYHQTDRWAPRVMAGSIYLLLLGYFFSSGVRFTFVTYTFAGVLLAYWRSRRRLVLPPVYLAAAACVAWAAVGWIGLNRGITTDAAAPASSVAQGTLDSAEIVKPLAAIIAVTSRDGFEFGSTYRDLVVQPVPRALWPNKPEPRIRSVIGRFSDPSEGRAFPFWGELYLNFGIPGLALGMFAVGQTFSRLFRTVIQGRGEQPGLEVALGLGLPLTLQVLSRGYFVQVVYNVAFIMGPAVLLARMNRCGGARWEAGRVA